MSMAMCLWVLEHSFKNLEKLEKQTKAILSSWLSNTNSNIEKTTNISRGTGYVPTNKKPNFSPLVSKNMQDPKGEYLWLFSGTK